MLRKIIFILFFFCNFNLNSVIANEVKIVAIVNQDIITSYDVYKEIRLIENIEKKKITQNDNIFILNKLIDEKIREIEINKQKIIIEDRAIKIRMKQILKKSKFEKNIELENLLYNKIKINLSWNKLILMKFKNKLEINTSEIDEKINSNKTNKNRDEIIKLAKMNKAEILSKTYFNEIKQKIYVKII